jgi:hypothetical protein
MIQGNEDVKRHVAIIAMTPDPCRVIARSAWRTAWTTMSRSPRSATTYKRCGTVESRVRQHWVMRRVEPLVLADAECVLVTPYSLVNVVSTAAYGLTKSADESSTSVTFRQAIHDTRPSEDTALWQGRSRLLLASHEKVLAPKLVARTTRGDGRNRTDA